MGENLNQNIDQKGSFAGRKKYIFKLFVAGSSSSSIRAISNLSELCREYLDDDYELQIIDVYNNPHIREIENIMAIPTLIKVAPLPERTFTGDLSRTSEVLSGLGFY